MKKLKKLKFKVRKARKAHRAQMALVDQSPICRLVDKTPQELIGIIGLLRQRLMLVKCRLWVLRRRKQRQEAKLMRRL